MKRCPYCGMSNASTSSVCLNCWERLDEIKDDENLAPMPPSVNYGNVLLNADARIMNMVLNAKHDATFRASSVLLAGVFISMFLALGEAYGWAVIAMLGSITVAVFFNYLKTRNKQY